MMKKVWVALLTLVMGLSLSGMALAGTPGGKAAEPAKPMAPADKPAEKSGAAKEAKGKVVSVNPGNKTFVVEAEGKKRMTFSVAEPAAKTLPAIKSGDQVTVRYTEDGGKLTAQEISKG